MEEFFYKYESDDIKNLFSESDLKSSEQKLPTSFHDRFKNFDNEVDDKRFKDYDGPDDINNLFSEADLKSPEPNYHGKKFNNK